MYAVIHHYKATSGSTDDMFKQVDREFADRVPERVGSLLYSAVDTGDGTAVTILLFGDEEAAQRSDAAAKAVLKSLADRFGVRETAVYRGPVMVSRASDAVVAPVRIGA
jgi:hypothetical protein